LSSSSNQVLHLEGAKDLGLEAGRPAFLLGTNGCLVVSGQSTYYLLNLTDFEYKTDRNRSNLLFGLKEPVLPPNRCSIVDCAGSGVITNMAELRFVQNSSLSAGLKAACAAAQERAFLSQPCISDDLSVMLVQTKERRCVLWNVFGGGTERDIQVEASCTPKAVEMVRGQPWALFACNSPQSSSSLVLVDEYGRMRGRTTFDGMTIAVERDFARVLILDKWEKSLLRVRIWRPEQGAENPISVSAEEAINSLYHTWD
jgi:hypothetical protein